MELKNEKLCSSVEYMKCYDPSTWLEERPAPLISMLRVITDLDLKDEKFKLKMAILVEHVYSCLHERLVLPFLFRQNLLMYSFSRSRALVDVFNAFLPAGAHTYSSNWLTENSKEPIPFPEGFVHVIFDNE